jgi:hypothetical protein
MRNIIIVAVLLIIVFLGGFFAARQYFKVPETDPVEESTILLEKIQKVCKLVTVEGHFVEHYDYGDPPAGPWFIGPMPNWQAWMPRKSARLRIRAKVSVGYDLADIKVEAFPDERRIYISGLPEPEILSVDHEIDYFDKTESIFRPLTEEDYLKIYKGAEDKIREAAGMSDLVQSAAEQGNELFDLIEFMVVNAGWALEVKGNYPVKKRDSLWVEY